MLGGLCLSVSPNFLDFLEPFGISLSPSCPSLMDGRAGRGRLLLATLTFLLLVFGMCLGIWYGAFEGVVNWVFGMVLLVFWDVGVSERGGCW